MDKEAMIQEIKKNLESLPLEEREELCILLLDFLAEIRRTNSEK